MVMALLLKFKSWLLGLGGILILIGAIYTKGKRQGKANAIEKDRKELQKDVKKKQTIENDVANDSDDELDKRLSDWIKD